MNLVLFLGAGFSKPFEHPVMNEFLGFADACPKLDGEDRDFLGRLVLEARRANAFLESSATNLEDILSFSEMGQRLGLEKENMGRGDRLKQIIAKVYTATKNSTDYWNRYDVLETFLGRKLPSFAGRKQAALQSSLTFITTNYDLNLECALRKFQQRANPGFPLVRPDGEEGGLYDEQGLPLFKLHGSVNWYPSVGGAGVEVVDKVERVESFEAGDRLRELPWPCCGNYTPPGVPLIIPPSFLKPDLPDALRAIWRGAAKALSEAHVIAFVGYSFPPSDTEMMYFLARALAENASLRSVYVVDIRANALVDRLKDKGSKMGSHFRDLLRPVEGDWSKLKSSPLPARRDLP